MKQVIGEYCEYYTREQVIKDVVGRNFVDQLVHLTLLFSPGSVKKVTSSTSG
jgi:hypothetical protein